MNKFRMIPALILLLAVSASAAQTPSRAKVNENAALRYWSAFAQMQDAAITDEQAKELNLILGGTAPYADVKYRELVEKNKPAFDTMIRGTALPNCDWGMDYALGSDTPVDFVRKALTLGSLNVLNVMHLLQAGDKDGAVRALAAGLRFSHDVANGGTLFSSAVAKHLLDDHLRVIELAIHAGGLTPAQEAVLRNAVNQLGSDGLDWKSNVRRELEVFHADALGQIVPAYIGVLDNPSSLSQLQQMIASAPKQMQYVIPNPAKVIDAKQDLSARIQQVRGLLQ